MKIIGTAGGISTPRAFLSSNSSSLEILSANCTYGVGMIPHCSVQIPLEELNKIPTQQTSTQWQVMVGDGEGGYVPLFTGYIAGPSGRVRGTHVSAGVDLVHTARDLDQMRISAPQMLCGGVYDYNYTLRATGPYSGGSALDVSAATFFQPGAKISEAVIKGLVYLLEHFPSINKDANYQLKKIDLAPCVELLKRVKGLDGPIKGEVAVALSGSGNGSINQWIQSQAKGSMTAFRSVWDTLTMIFAHFGIFFICTPDGSLWASPDTGGFSAAKENYLGPDYITSFDLTSQLVRNIREVNLVTDSVTTTLYQEGIEVPAESRRSPATLVTYPDPGDSVDSGSGGSMAVSLPGWLNPLRQKSPNPQILAAQKRFAQAQYYLERNKFRTMAVTGPMAPGAIPGTVALVSPYPALHAMSGEGADFANTTYEGYCYQVDHLIDAASKVAQTSFYFRNVTESISGEQIDAHPIFADVKPFVWL